MIIQGFGNVGSNAPCLMAEAGYKIIGIVEVDGGLTTRTESTSRRSRNTASAIARPRIPRSREADPAELLVTECDILIPAATENQITSRNADRVKCKILAEGANGPTTAAADEILADKKVFVIPDILCNAGGVTTSYFEWVQDRQGYFWKESVVNEQLEHIMNDRIRGRGPLRGDAQREQPHRRLHAGDRPGGLHHPAARNLRLGLANGMRRKFRRYIAVTRGSEDKAFDRKDRKEHPQRSRRKATLRGSIIGVVWAVTRGD